MIVLSLFDGFSGGQIALERAGIKVDKYYASEIDKYAIKVTQNNYPNTIQLGSIENWIEWDIEKPDLIIGGSPCQGFSFAGKQLNFDDPRSKLFFKFVEVLYHYRPKYFLLENVRMKKEFQNVISENMGVEPIEINSALVSAQNRKRLYWTNIPGVEQPEDKGILLKDIIEDGGVDRGKSYCVDANYFKGGNLNQYFNKSRRQLVFCGRQIGRARNSEGKRIDHKQSVAGLTTQEIELREDEKTNCLSTVQKDNIVVYTDNYLQWDTSGKGHKSQDQRAFYLDKKHGCIPASRTDSKVKVLIDKENMTYRKLTPIECERLQTVPDGYTNHVSNTQRYKMLGNGFTVDVIAHILKNIVLEEKE